MHPRALDEIKRAELRRRFTCGDSISQVATFASLSGWAIGRGALERLRREALAEVQPDPGAALLEISRSLPTEPAELAQLHRRALGLADAAARRLADAAGAQMTKRPKAA